MNDAKSAHPAAARLADYALGRMDPAEMAEVERHLAVCLACSRVVGDQPADTLVGLLRARGQGQPAPAADPAEALPPVDLTIPSSFIRPRPAAPEETPTVAGPASGVAGADTPAGPAIPGFHRPRAAAPHDTSTIAGLSPSVAEAETQAGGTQAGPFVPGLPPDLIDHPRYRVLSLLGAGGMGSVYLAEHRLMERKVALKVIRHDLVENPGLIDRFHREVRAAARLAHPNIVTAYDAEQVGGMHMLVMEYVEGADLAHVLAGRGPLPANEACHYARQAALGLQHAHERGMVHRDIKPQNLMRLGRGVVKILDFGLARFASEVAAQGGLTAENMILGSIDYMAPEQIDDPHAADTRADIYSLGCTLYHLLAGTPPFPTGTVIQKLSFHACRQPAALAEVRPDLPPGLADVVGRMMAKDPARRYQAPVEVARALAPFANPARPAAGAPIAAVEPRPGPIAPGPPAEPSLDRRFPGPPSGRRRPALLAMLVLPLGALLAAGIGYRIVTDRGELIIETSDPDARVELKQGGRVVTIIDPQSDEKFVVRSGRYEVGLVGDAGGLAVEPTTVTIMRGDREIVRVTRKPRIPEPLTKPGAPAAGPATPSVVAAGAGGLFRRFEGHTAGVVGVAVSPDGTRLLTGGRDQTVRLWDVATGKQLRHFSGNTAQVWRVAFAPDGKAAASAEMDGTLRHWDLESGAELGQFLGHHGAAAALAFAPDGRHLISGGLDGTVRLWEVATRRELRRFEGHSGHVWSVAFAPDGKTALTGGGTGEVDCTMRLWDVEGGKELRRFEGHVLPIRGVAFAPDGKTAISGGEDQTLRSWDLETGRELRRLRADDEQGVIGVAWVNGGRALTSGYDGTVRLWDVEAGTELQRFGGHAGEVCDVVASPDGRFAFSADEDRTARMWRLNGPQSLNAARRFRGHAGSIEAVAIAPDGKTALSGGEDRLLRLWDLADGTVLRTMAGHTNLIRDLAFAPDGKTAITGSGDGDARVWDLETGRGLQRLEGHTSWVEGVALAPDGKTALSGGGEGFFLRLWDLADGTELRRFAGHTRVVQQIAIAPDGKTALSGSADRTIRLWDLATGAELRRFAGHTQTVRSVVYAPHGRTALSGSLDATVRLWDVATGAELRRFAGHRGPVHQVAIGPDGRRALSCGNDRDIRLWDLQTGRELARFAPGAAAVHSVAFAPDGRTALSGDTDGTLSEWRLPDPQAAATDGP